jgi:hypothetical protein
LRWRLNCKFQKWVFLGYNPIKLHFQLQKVKKSFQAELAGKCSLFFGENFNWFRFNKFVLLKTSSVPVILSLIEPKKLNLQSIEYPYSFEYKYRLFSQNRAKIVSVRLSLKNRAILASRRLKWSYSVMKTTKINFSPRGNFF